MERGGRGTGGRGGYRGRGGGRGRGTARGRGGDDGGDQQRPSYQPGLGRGRGGVHWNPTNTQAATGQEGDGRGGGRGGGTARGRGGYDGGDQQPSSYQPVLGRGRGGVHWNPTNSQATTGQDGAGRGGYPSGGGSGRGVGNVEREAWIPRSQRERPNYSQVTQSAGGGTGGVSGGGSGRGVGNVEREACIHRSQQVRPNYSQVTQSAGGGTGGVSGGGSGRGVGNVEREACIHRSQQVRPNYSQVTQSAGGGTGSGSGGGSGRGVGNVEREAWITRSQPERLSYSHVTQSAGGGTGGGSRGKSSRSVAAPTPVPEVTLPPSPPHSVTDSVVINVSEKLASSSLSPGTKIKDNPIMRPDKGGTVAVANVKLNVNHFRVGFDHNSIIRQYHIDVKPSEPPKNGRPVKLSKPLLSEIRTTLFTDNPDLPLLKTAYDGEQNIFSAVQLLEGEFSVELSDGEDSRPRKFVVSIRLVNELELHKLRDYLSKNTSSIPRGILHGMDVVMKENPVMRMIPVGRSFHPFEALPEDDLKGGLTASRGIQFSLKPTFQGLALCLDYSVLAFRKKMPVLDFLDHHIFGFNVNNFRRHKPDVVRVLRNLKVNVTHRHTKQKYVIVGLTSEDTRNASFSDANNPKVDIKVVDYFMEKYGASITYLDIPCLDLSRNNRMNYVPMEYCVLAEGQIYPRDKLDQNATRSLKDMSLPYERQRKICGMIQSDDGPCRGETIQNFGIQVDTKMTSVVGRVIGPPVLKLAARNTGKMMKVTVDKQTCQWNLVEKAVVEGKAIERWGIIDFARDDRARPNLNMFIGKLIDRCKSLGIEMKHPLVFEKSQMRILSDINKLRELLQKVSSVKENLQFLLCVMSRKDDGYKYLKWISETKIGIVTQCCLSNNAINVQDQYLANLALKINAKLGGSNVELNDRLPHFHGKGHVMFVGADVNHPGSNNNNKKISSIAAVVATMNWPEANRYAARVLPQKHRKEQIVEFGKMCLELVESYDRLNNVKPEKIVLFRDGVGENQFNMVLNDELLDLKTKFKSINYFPTITLIVAQKRHQTRFFPQGRNDGVHTGNISPGTVVDTIIVHPYEFDFYLCSHHGTLGTSKPTHYHVLLDENEFSSDQLQRLIYNMCFTFARCTKPVSLVPPVYYADLVAYRGRLYHQAIERQRQTPISTSSPSSSLASPSSVSSADCQDWVELHKNLENKMFFI